MTRPSREFMVQQAVLTAMSRDYPRGYTHPMVFFGMVAKGTLPVSVSDLREIRDEFRKLEAQYA